MSIKDDFGTFLKKKTEDVIPPTIPPTPATKVIVVKNKLVEDKNEPVIEPKEDTLEPLTESDLMDLKKIAYSEINESELSIQELVDLVILAKSNKPVKKQNIETLAIREFVSEDGKKITPKGRVYLENVEVKNRLKALIKQVKG